MGRSQRKKEGKAKERKREGMLLEEMRERELTERSTEKERQGERKAGILKAAVTPVTSHLSNPAPT